MKFPELSYTSPLEFSRKQRLQLSVAPPAIAVALRCLLGTCRWELRDAERFESLIAEGRKVILAFWHESMALSLYRHRNRNFHTTTSYSFDGEMAARVLSHLGVEAVRGSSSRGGSNALVQLKRALALVPCVGITLDGPRGPRRQAKPGVAVLAAKTGAIIIPNAYGLRRCKRLRSWDKFPVPYPLSRITCAYGTAIAPPEDMSPHAIERKRLEVEHQLNALHEQLEREPGMIP